MTGVGHGHREADAGERQPDDDRVIAGMKQRLFEREPNDDFGTRVVLWFEQDDQVSEPEVSALVKKLKSRLRRINAKIVIINMELARMRPIQGLDVRNADIA